MDVLRLITFGNEISTSPSANGRIIGKPIQHIVVNLNQLWPCRPSKRNLAEEIQKYVNTLTSLSLNEF